MPVIVIRFKPKVRYYAKVISFIAYLRLVWYNHEQDISRKRQSGLKGVQDGRIIYD